MWLLFFVCLILASADCELINRTKVKGRQKQTCRSGKGKGGEKGTSADTTLFLAG
jgi:hypothetical protein